MLVFRELRLDLYEVLDGTWKLLPFIQRSSRVAFHTSGGASPENPHGEDAQFSLTQVVSTGTILLNICEYGIPFIGPWLIPVMECLYWIYIGISMVASAGMYLILWSTQCVLLL